MKFNTRNLVVILLSIPLCSYTGYKKCAPCAKSDLKGRIKKLTEIEQVGTDETEKQIYLYNAQGELGEARDSVWKEYEEGSPKELVYTSVVKYLHEGGRLVKEESGNISETWGRGKKITAYSYDEKGRVISELEYEPLSPKSDQFLREYSYNDKNRQAIRKRFNKAHDKEAAEDIYRRCMDVYDGEGRVIETWRYLPDSSSYKLYELLRYDQAGNMVESKSRDNEGLERSRAFQFNTEGQLIAATYELPSGLKRTISYTYSEPDGKGNYLKIVSSGDIVTSREIEYYE